MAEYLLDYLVGGRAGTFDRLFAFLDTVPVAKKRQDAIGGLKVAIACQLPATPYVIEAHVTQIFQKLGLAESPDQHRRALAVLAFLRS